MGPVASREGLGRYVRLMGVAGVVPVVAASVVARLPAGMVSLALLLLVVAETRSYAEAGAVVGCFALASAVGSPLRGRLCDRLGPTPVLLVTGCAQPAALLGALAAVGGARDDPAPLLVAVSVAGLLVPPAGPVTRAVWQRLVIAPDLARAAFALDSLLLQLIYYLAGPPLAAVLATELSPATAMLAVAALTLVGNVATALTPAVRAVPRRHERRHLLGPLIEPRLVAVLAVAVVVSAAFAALDTAVASYALAEHAPGWSGPLLALVGLGSIAGGLAFGAHTPTTSTSTQYRRGLLALTLGALPLVLTPNVAVLGGLLVIAGAAIGPVSTCQFNLVGELAPPGTLTEAFTWLFSAVLAGTSLGSLLAGFAAQHLGPQAALAGPAVLAALAGSLTLALGRPPRPLRRA